MSKTTWLKLVTLAGAVAFFASGCVYPEQRGAADAEVEVEGEPPAAIVEDIPPDPGAGYVWIGGAWTWQNRWMWERGHWDRPPHPGAVWVPNRYYNHGGKHVYVHGKWK